MIISMEILHSQKQLKILIFKTNFHLNEINCFHEQYFLSEKSYFEDFAN